MDSSSRDNNQLENNMKTIKVTAYEAQQDLELCRAHLDMIIADYDTGLTDYADVKRAHRAYKAAKMLRDSIK